MKRRLTILAALLLGGCAAEYHNDNGPRGPESWKIGGCWPWSVCKPAPMTGAPAK